MSNSVDLEELKKLLATQAGTLPWQLITEHETVSDHVGPYEVVVGVRNAAGVLVMATDDDGENYNPQEARLIYSAVAALPKLIDEIERLERENSEMQSVVDAAIAWNADTDRIEDTIALEAATHEYLRRPTPPALQSGGSNAN